MEEDKIQYGLNAPWPNGTRATTIYANRICEVEIVGYEGMGFYEVTFLHSVRKGKMDTINKVRLKDFKLNEVSC